MYQFVSKYLYKIVWVFPVHWDGKSLLTASALIPNFSFHPSSSPMNQWWTIKSIFGTNFSLAKFMYHIISYHHIIQAIDGRNFVAQNTVPQNIGGRPKISSGKILMVGILLPKILFPKILFPKILVGEIFLLKILVVNSKYCWAKYWWAGQMPYISDLAWPHLTRVNHLPSIQRRENPEKEQGNHLSLLKAKPIFA